MKVLTLWQPWATLMAIGAKQHETRSWRTDYRGLVLIHAAKRYPRRADFTPEILDALGQAYSSGGALSRTADRLPYGRVVAVGNLVEIFPTQQLSFVNAKSGMTPRGQSLVAKSEEPFGDYRPGRFAWRFEGLVALDPQPIVKGARGLRDASPALVQTVAGILNDRELVAA